MVVSSDLLFHSRVCEKREAGQELGVTQTQLEAAETGAKVCTGA